MSTCSCGHPLWAPTSIARGYCEYCRMLGDYRHAIAGLRTFPYRLPAGFSLEPRKNDEPNLYAPARARS